MLCIRTKISVIYIALKTIRDSVIIRNVRIYALLMDSVLGCNVIVIKVFLEMIAHLYVLNTQKMVFV